MPEGHAVQTVAPLPEKVLAAHCVQLEAEPPAEAVPAAHCVQLVAVPPAETVPAAHAKHKPEDKYCPALQEVRAGQALTTPIVPVLGQME